MTVFFRSTGTVRKGWPRGVRVPITVAIIEGPQGITLIDTGWSRRVCAFPEDQPGRLRTAIMGLDVKAEDALASQLIGLGATPDDVRAVVATSLHPGHVGGIVDFPKAALHTADAASRHPGMRLQDLGERLKVHALNGPPMMGFGASHDLHGDGSLWMLDASAYVPGAVAVALRLDTGWLVHTGNVDPGFGIHGARLVTSHDAAVYETLPHTRETGWKTVWDRKPKPAPVTPGRRRERRDG